MCGRLIYLISSTLVLALAGSASADLMGYWKFNEGSGNVAQDGSGNRNDGAVLGATWVEEGKFDSALSFDSGDSVEIPHSESLSFTEEITVMAWCNSTGISSNPTVVGKGSGDPTVQFELSLQSSGIFWQFKYDDGTWVECVLSPVLSMGEWHHIAGTFDGETFRVYLDGELGAELQSPQEGLPGNDLPVVIGKRIDPDGRLFEGMIDEVAIYNRALSGDEILVDMAGMAGVVPELASAPNPADEAIDVPRDVALGWEAGEFAVTHDVYFGTVFDDINDADRANPLDVLISKDQEAQTSDPGRLDFGMTYYWRIDEVNAPPDSTVFKGDVWNFKVEPVSFPIAMGAVTATASSIDDVQDPSNAVNGSGLNENDEHSSLLKDMWSSDTADTDPWIQFDFDQVQPLDKVHIWNHNSQTESILGFGIKEALIEYSPDGETWMEFATVELAQASGAPTDTGFDVALDGIVAKAVKISGLSNYSILGLPQKGLSEVRFYAVPLRARLEVPADGTTDLDPLVDLSWREGREAAQHQVLIGTDPENLTQVATVDDPAYTAAVDLNSTVYWQINEVNEATDPSLWEGDLWSFDTAGFVIVDDMESYKSREGGWIWETWTDGFGDDDNGALLGHNGDDMETTIVFDGKQSLPYYYGQGGAASSEASRDINRDWGQHGIVSLSLMFYGSTSAIAGEMYVKVNDEKVATYPTSADLTVEEWHTWAFDLPAAALGQVDTLAIGFEGGTGWVFIDAIRLYPEASE